jgi:hypothetical protein
VDGVVSRIRDFLQSHDATSLFLQKATDDPSLAAFYTACAADPRLQVRVVAQSREKQLWQISYIGP